MARTWILHVSLLLAPALVLACSGRSVPSSSDGAGGQGDGSVASRDQSGGLLPHCSGADKVILDGKSLPNNHVAGTVRAEPPGDLLRVTVSQGSISSDSSWSGVFVDLIAPTPLKPGAPLMLDLSALDPGWRIGASRFGGGCLYGQQKCKSAASPVAKPTDHFQGQLRLEAGPAPGVSLCLSVAEGVGQRPFLEVFVQRVGLERD